MAQRKILLGFDVSYANDADIAFKAAYKAGVRFVGIKISEGATIRDRLATKVRIKAILDAGLVPILYHFAYPENGSDWLAEAKWFLKICEDLDVDWSKCIPALDWERVGPTPNGPWCINWLKYVTEQTGRKKGTLVFYGSPGLIVPKITLAQRGEIKKYAALWHAEYGVSEPRKLAPWAWPPKFWQRSDAQRFAGVDGLVDGDVFYGTEDQLRAFARG
jgi:GH25 family lysozyme M1 (1,4-beta-N-acetylmuramidase)